jgi:hypothetical protein
VAAHAALNRGVRISIVALQISRQIRARIVFASARAISVGAAPTTRSVFGSPTPIDGAAVNRTG